MAQDLRFHRFGLMGGAIGFTPFEDMPEFQKKI